MPINLDNIDKKLQKLHLDFNISMKNFFNSERQFGALDELIKHYKLLDDFLKDIGLSSTREKTLLEYTQILSDTRQERLNKAIEERKKIQGALELYFDVTK